MLCGGESDNICGEKIIACEKRMAREGCLARSSYDIDCKVPWNPLPPFSVATGVLR